MSDINSNVESVVETDQPVSEPLVGQDELDESLGNAFLKNVPEVDRKVLEPYVKQWDAGVTKRFQRIHDTYRPYKDLGEVQDIQDAIRVYTMMNNDPESVIKILAEYMEQDVTLTPRQQAQLAQAVQQQTAGQGETPELPYEGALPEEFLGEWGQIKQLVLGMGQFLASQQKVTQKQQEDQQLDSYLSELKTKHGDFNEEYVLMKMAQGVDGNEAVKAWRELVQAEINRAAGNTPKPPPVLNGHGAVPTGHVDTSKLPAKGSKELLAQMLANSNKE